MTKVNNGEYEYGGLCVNGFLMLFFLFLLAPALLAGCVYLVLDKSIAHGSQAFYEIEEYGYRAYKG